MFKPSAFNSNLIFSILCVTLFTASMSGGASPAAAEDCQAALGSSTGAVALSNGTSTTKSQGVDEWDGDVLKIRTSLPGVVVIEASGVAAQSSLYTQGSSSHPLVDRARLGTNLRDLRAVVRAGDHCIQVAPPAGATGTYAVTASFTDVCHLGDPDDHGDSVLCATSISVGGTSSGEISPASTTSDYDMFTFELTSAATVKIESTGSTDVAGELYDNDGALLEADDNGGTSPNFLIVRSLGAGRYYIQIEGVNDDGAYGLSVSLVP